MKYKGLFNFCSIYLSSDFLIKNRNVSTLLKNCFEKKYFYLLILFLSFSISSFSSIHLPKAALTKSKEATPIFGSGHVNITVGTATTTGGTWAGAGTISSPYIFTPNGTSTANINATQLATALNTYAYVQITTATSAAGTNSGTVIFESFCHT
jgi:hypothetical protein